LVAEQLKNLPSSPGVYLMKDAGGKILYVGKATELRSRVRSYFQSPAGLTPKTVALVAEIHDLEFYVTTSEQAALILEDNLVKRYRPHYNIRLKDDKTYPYIKIDLKEDWPTVVFTRTLKNDGAHYFGPFASARSVRQTMKVIEAIFGYRTCNKDITGKDRRACLKFFLKRCSAPCTGNITREDYLDIMRDIILFLEGKQDAVIRGLEQKMKAAAEQMNFEGAARFRDQIAAVKQISEGQKIAATVSGEQDAIAFVTDRDQAFVMVFFVRHGKLIGRESFMLTGVNAEDPKQIMTSFVKQFYGAAAYIPPRLLLQYPIEDKNPIQEWLKQKRGRPVNIIVPEKGSKKQLIDIVLENAKQGWQQEKIKQIAGSEVLEQALKQLQETLKLPHPPGRIEGYDISNIQGKEAVGSMVVFVEGKSKPSHYRRFRIKTVEGVNDYAMLQEVLRRRFKRGAAAADTWAALPDLVLIDGGKGQLNAAREALAESKAESQPVLGLAKENEEIYVPGKSKPIVLPRNAPGLQLLQRVRDEAHRFAITYHGDIHRKKSFVSALDSVRGIGPAKKKALIAKFGTVRGIRAASIEELMQVEGVTRSLAETIKDSLG
ncbi:MAG: excinuclease ABC subunit UvrC, partial [Dehalococcoidales bacterium]|nr:excinuclease ABC subunit UvrC [Dehalococcoidales bacterium]